MRPGMIPRTIGSVLGSSGIAGSLLVLNVGLVRGEPLAIAASGVLLLVSIAILHDTGAKVMALAIIMASTPVLVGLYLLLLWLSLRNWEGPG
jgi:hypothetical protein